MDNLKQQIKNEKESLRDRIKTAEKNIEFMKQNHFPCSYEMGVLNEMKHELDVLDRWTR